MGLYFPLAADLDESCTFVPSFVTTVTDAAVSVINCCLLSFRNKVLFEKCKHCLSLFIFLLAVI